MKNNISFLFLSLIIVSLSIIGCKKPNEAVLLGDTGSNIIKLFSNVASGDVYRSYLNLSTTTQTLKIMELRRDMVSNADLSKPMSVILTLDPALVTKYNTDNEAELIAPPSGSFTFANLNPASGNNVTVNFAAGEFAKDILIVIPNGTLFDPAETYALGFKIQSITNGGGAISSNYGSLVAKFSAKNKYDGIYTLKGSITRNSATGPDLVLGGVYPVSSPLTMELVTLSENTVSIVPLWVNGSGVGGIAGTYLTIDPATNLVVVKSTGNASLKNTIGEVNKYDPATKTFELAFDWGAAPSTRIVKATLTYKSER